jgi:hypothetical protein
VAALRKVQVLKTGTTTAVRIDSGYLGLNAIESGNLNPARSYLERALAIARDLDLAIPSATVLMYFATLAAAQLHPVRALQLAGASESLAASAGAVPLRLTRTTVERWLDKSCLQLGPGRSAACLAEGVQCHDNARSNVP